VDASEKGLLFNLGLLSCVPTLGSFAVKKVPTQSSYDQPLQGICISFRESQYQLFLDFCSLIDAAGMFK
jgi:hypothetical protein